MVDTLEHTLLTALLTPPGQACPVLVLTWKLEKSESPCFGFYTSLLYKVSQRVGADPWDKVWDLSLSGMQAEQSLCAFSRISGLSLCGLAHMVCSFLIHTSMARYVLHARILDPPRSAPDWVALCKCISHLLNSQWDQAGVFKQSWQSFHIYLDDNMYNRFCFLSQKLFVQIWLCVSAQAQTIAAIHAGLGVVYTLPDLFVCGVVPSLEMPVYWGLFLIFTSFPTHILNFTLSSNTAEV